MKEKYTDQTIKTLAVAFYPSKSVASASRCLRHEINLTPKLKNELKKTGHQIKKRNLTPMQVKLIFSYLGNPFCQED